MTVKAERPMRMSLPPISEHGPIRGYRGALQQAEGIIGSFGSVIVEDAAPQIRERALRGTFWGGAWRGIFANALYTLGLIAVVVILTWVGVDLLSIMNGS
jgi:hypothetical protein